MKNLIISGFLFLLGVSYSQTTGCTDPLANNFNEEADINDGSCIYPVTEISPVYSEILPDVMEQTSGLRFLDEELLTFNDFMDIQLYSFYPDSVSDYTLIEIPGVSNVDWEEVAQDEEYLYIGDFGNNFSGNRTDLKIYRIKKSELSSNPQAEIISFSYETQTDFNPVEFNTTNYDCEAFIVGSEKIYLFSKEWTDFKTSVYELDKTPGEQIAVFKDSYHVNGLITGAEYLEESRFIALSGYNQLLKPFLFLLYDFRENNFFGGNKRRISLSLNSHQVEGIASKDGREFYISNEKITIAGNTIPQKIHQLDLTEFTDGYLNAIQLADGPAFKPNTKIQLFPNPTNGELNLKFPKDFELSGNSIRIFDLNGREIKSFSNITRDFKINLKGILPHTGTYIMILIDKKGEVLFNRKFIYY